MRAHPSHRLHAHPFARARRIDAHPQSTNQHPPPHPAAPTADRGAQHRRLRRTLAAPTFHAPMTPLHIAGLGRYLPARTVPTAEMAARCGVSAEWALARTGVCERRVADPNAGETSSGMAALAARAALDDAGMDAAEIDLIVNASGTNEQTLPDGGPLVARALGLSGTPAFSVHATCLSFVAALDVASAFLAAGRYRRILVVSSERPSVGLNVEQPESALLMGDGAAAAVLTASAGADRAPGLAPPGLHAFRFETYGDGAHLTEVRGGGTRLHPNDPATTPADNLFTMDGLGVLRMARARLPAFLDRLAGGLSRGLDDVAGIPGGRVDVVVPHQASLAGVRIAGAFGWPDDRVVVTLGSVGNTIAASIPMALCEAVTTGRLRRGQTALLVGTGAGFSMGGALLTY